jgi:thiamine biosynthesis lipoprotein
MMPTRRNLMLMTGCAVMTSALPGLAGRAQIIGGPAFASWWRASLPADCDVMQIDAAIEKVIEEIDAKMSPYRSTSELNLLNRAPDGHWLPVSDITSQVISESLRIAHLTEGAFDPTVGPLVRRFGFGPIIGAVKADYRSVVLGARGLRKSVPKATLDLCGIAKGYALDQMALAVEALGVRSFLLEAGGEVLARGRHPDGRPWHVGIETHGTVPPKFQHVVRLDGMALATSGTAVNGGTRSGVGFNHIIDARTARPVANGVASVSVIAESGMQADALATSLMVMGAANGLELAEQMKLAVLFQLEEGQGDSEVMSERFASAIIA